MFKENHSTKSNEEQATEIVNTLRLITCNEPDAVTEIRLLPRRRSDRTVSGYFDAEHFESVPGLLLPRLKQMKYTAYLTLHRLHPGLIARYNNRFEEAPEKTTTDSEVIAYRWLFVDLDPVRPSGINATNEEMKAAISVGKDVCQYCTSVLGLPEPVKALSGNGAHLLFPFNQPATKETAELVKNILGKLGSQFDTEHVKIDDSNFNAGRITKLYGLLCSKGDGSAARPARYSSIVKAVDV